MENYITANAYGIGGEIQQLVTFITRWVTKKH